MLDKSKGGDFMVLNILQVAPIRTGAVKRSARSM